MIVCTAGGTIDSQDARRNWVYLGEIDSVQFLPVLVPCNSDRRHRAPGQKANGNCPEHVLHGRPLPRWRAHQELHLAPQGRRDEWAERGGCIWRWDKKLIQIVPSIGMCIV